MKIKLNNFENFGMTLISSKKYGDNDDERLMQLFDVMLNSVVTGRAFFEYTSIDLLPIYVAKKSDNIA